MIFFIFLILRTVYNLNTPKMSLAEEIRDAPCKTCTLQDFKLLLQQQTTSDDTKSCLQVSVDFGAEYTRVFSWQPGEFIFFDFLVKGDFLPDSDKSHNYRYFDDVLTIRPDTPNVFPMPVTPKSQMCVRGPIVVAVFSKQFRKDYWRGHHCVGDWIVEPDVWRVRFVPKDYVLQSTWRCRRTTPRPAARAVPF